MDTDYDIWLALNGFSKHKGGEAEYRESNPGLGLGFRKNGHQIGLGGYRNSNNNDSYYIDYLISRKLFGPVDIGLGGGVVTGYENGIQPYLLPQLSIGNKNQQLNLRYVPERGHKPETWMMNFEYRMK